MLADRCTSYYNNDKKMRRAGRGERGVPLDAGRQLDDAEDLTADVGHVLVGEPLEVDDAGGRVREGEPADRVQLVLLRRHPRRDCHDAERVPAEVGDELPRRAVDEVRVVERKQQLAVLQRQLTTTQAAV